MQNASKNERKLVHKIVSIGKGSSHYVGQKHLIGKFVVGHFKKGVLKGDYDGIAFYCADVVVETFTSDDYPEYFL